MYRCCNKCCCNSNEEVSPLDETCMDVADSNCNSCNFDSCACGFDEQESVFPLNPMLGQSYVPVQRMTNVFTPICGLKKWNNISRACKPILSLSKYRRH